jgi:hypothetical protein
MNLESKKWRNFWQENSTLLLRCLQPPRPHRPYRTQLLPAPPSPISGSSQVQKSFWVYRGRTNMLGRRCLQALEYFSCTRRLPYRGGLYFGIFPSCLLWAASRSPCLAAWHQDLWSSDAGSKVFTGCTSLGVAASTKNIRSSPGHWN